MSYRTYINNKQIFGNNESYPEWIAFMKSQGIEVSEEGYYEGTVTDFMGMLKTVEAITMRLYKERDNDIQSLKRNNYSGTLHGIFDLSDIPETMITQAEANQTADKYDTSLFDKLQETIKSGYAFMPYQLYEACKDKLEADNLFSTPGHMNCYKIKSGEVIVVRAN